MAAPHRITYKGHDLQVWGLKIATSGFDVVLECETCHTQFTMKVLEELAETRASKNIGTPDVFCCALPPFGMRGASNIGALLIRCGLGMPTGAPPAQPPAASTAPPDRIYRMEHRGETFRLHGITSRLGSGLLCTICKRLFPLEKITAALDFYIDVGSACRDFTCCQVVEGAGTRVVQLGGIVGTGAQSAEPKTACRWCKGTGRVTLLTTSAPCDCVKQEEIGGIYPGIAYPQPVPTNGGPHI